MGECKGKAPEPAPVVEPEPDPEPEQPKSSGGTLLLVLDVYKRQEIQLRSAPSGLAAGAGLCVLAGSRLQRH